MISYKRDVLERQSLSEVKMGRGSPICERVRKKIVEYFKNNVPQCQIAKALQISSSTEHNIISEKLEKSLCVRDNAEDLVGCSWSSGPQTTLHHSSAWFCHWHTKWAQEILPEPLSVKHNPPCHLQMPTKALSCKRKPYVNMVQKCHRVLWAKAHLKWTVSKWKSVLWSDESKFDILVGNHGFHVIRAKEEEDLQRVISVQFKSHHLWWYGAA